MIKRRQGLLCEFSYFLVLLIDYVVPDKKLAMYRYSTVHGTFDIFIDSIGWF
jgi:hypothetical protein